MDRIFKHAYTAV